MAALSASSNICAQGTELTIIGNVESVPSVMDMNLLKSIFKGEQMRWVDGSKVKLALMKANTPIGAITSEKIYNMTPNEVKKYFVFLIFQGKISEPEFFYSASELEAYVAQTPGAIGVLQNPADDQIKIIIVDGKKQI